MCTIVVAKSEVPGNSGDYPMVNAKMISSVDDRRGGRGYDDEANHANLIEKRLSRLERELERRESACWPRRLTESDEDALAIDCSIFYLDGRDRETERSLVDRGHKRGQELRDALHGPITGE